MKKTILSIVLVFALSCLLFTPILEIDASAASNGWVQKGGKWVYYENGRMLKNTWMADSSGWCYLGEYGYMLTDTWIKDSQGWCFVGSNGYCVTNCWKQDSKGWCYLDSNGRMAINQWVADSAGWCYVGADGYAVTNCWKKDSKGWCYLDANGRMAINSWVRDSIGWCYVGADGYAVTNCWKQDNIGWCYLDANGSMTKANWVKTGSFWYYLDAYGYMVTGPYVIGGTIYNFDNSGRWMDGYTSHTHYYYNYKCTTCGEVDKDHAYDYLMLWTKENGNASGAYTAFEYQSGDYTYTLSYSAQYDNLYISCYGSYKGNFIHYALFLDTYFYGCTFDTLKMYGYITPRTFTANTPITYTEYIGSSNVEPDMAELSRVGVCDLIDWLDWCLDEYDIGITIKDLGFTSF